MTLSSRIAIKLNFQEWVSLIYVLIMLAPNILLCFTEPYSWSTILASLLLPGAFYTLLTTWARRPGGWMLGSLLLMVLGAFQIVLLYLFGGSIIAVDMFTNLFTTNASEAGELLANIWPSILFVILLYLPLVGLCIGSLISKIEQRALFRRRMAWSSLGMVLLGGVFLVVSYTTRSGFGIQYHIFPVNVIYNIKVSIQRWTQSNAYPQTSRDFQFGVSRTQQASNREIYLFVIGEASRAASWSLFGNTHPTTPRMEQRVGKGLVAFSDVFTESNTTHKSVPLLLSAVSSENYNDIFQEKSIITAFKEAGFETLYISNQVPNRSLIDYFSEEADRRIDISPRENQLYTDNRPDGEMLPYLRQVIDSSDRNLFIVLHTYGSHFDYTKRYPREFAQFLPDQASSVNHEERDRVQNAYDNSIFYTDYLLDEMIAVLEQTQSCSALFYCADHGEDLMDDDRNRFLHASPTPTYYQLHVASIAWFSESYRQQFPAKYEASQRARQQPYSTGWVFHTLADMASLRSPYIDTTRALTNDGFTPTLQRMYITDHNQAIEFYNTGLAPEDLKALDQHHIAYPKEQVHRILY